MTAGGDSASSTQQPLGPKAPQPEPGSSSAGAREELILLFPCVLRKSPTERRNGVNSRDVGWQPKAEHSHSLVGKRGHVSRGHRSNVLWRRRGQGSLVHTEQILRCSHIANNILLHLFAPGKKKKCFVPVALLEPDAQKGR